MSKDDIIRREDMEPIDPGDHAMFRGYTTRKAQAMVAKGIEEYRASDFFALPLEDWGEERLGGILTGCEQIVAARGFTLETPMNGVSIASCYALIRTLHFEVIGRQTHRPEHRRTRLQEGVSARPEESLVIDEMRCKHLVSGFVGTLFNQQVYLRRDR